MCTLKHLIQVMPELRRLLANKLICRITKHALCGMVKTGHMAAEVSRDNRVIGAIKDCLTCRRQPTNLVIRPQLLSFSTAESHYSSQQHNDKQHARHQDAL